MAHRWTRRKDLLPGTSEAHVLQHSHPDKMSSKKMTINTKLVQYVLFTPAFSSAWIFRQLSISSIERIVEIILLNRIVRKLLTVNISLNLGKKAFKPDKTCMDSCGN